MRRPQARRHHGVAGAIRARGDAGIQGAPCGAPALARTAAARRAVPDQQLDLVAKPSDVEDAELRTLLLEAESLLDAKDYAGSIRTSMAAYSHLIDRRLDVIVHPADTSGIA